MKKWVLYLFVVASASPVFSQGRLIKGRVISDDLETLSGVSIVVKNSVSTGYADMEYISSDFEGRFEIEITDDIGELMFTYLGYDIATITYMNDCDFMEVVMMPAVIYDFMTRRKVSRLERERYERLPEIYMKAFEKGLFLYETPCPPLRNRKEYLEMTQRGRDRRQNNY